MVEKNIKDSRRQLYQRLFLRLVIAASVIFSLTYLAPYIFRILAPFFYAFLVALLLNPIISRLSAKFGIPRRFSALILVISVLSAFLGIIGWLAYIAVSELVMLADNLNEMWDSLVMAFAFLGSIVQDFLDIFPGDTDAFLSGLMDNANAWVNIAIADLGNSLLSRTPYFTTRVGGGVIDMIVFILASYFITAEYHVLRKMMMKHSDGVAHKYYLRLKSAVKLAFGGYIKAQLILSFMAFALIFPALLIMGQEYAFLLALLAAFLDFIPLLGTATLLVPWGIFTMLGGNIFYGVFLILLSTIFFVIRRIMEPKVMGAQTGLHPFVALLSVYAGWRMFGVLGAILGPIGVMVALNLIGANLFDATARDIKAAIDDCKMILTSKKQPGE